MITARHEYMDRPTLKSDLGVFDTSLTKQSDLRDCDINSIFKKFERTGVLPDMIVKDGRYGDFSNVPDYQSACDIVRHANEQFAALGVDIRNRFANDPVKFLEFANDPRNIEEMDRMGLLNAEASKQLADRKAAEDKAKIDAYEASKKAPVAPPAQ